MIFQDLLNVRRVGHLRFLHHPFDGKAGIKVHVQVRSHLLDHVDTSNLLLRQLLKELHVLKVLCPTPTF